MVLLCCGVPVAWVVLQIAINPGSLLELQLDGFRVRLLARTLLYNAAVAVGATLVALPVAMSLGRGRGVFAKLLWVVLPVALLLPSIVVTYGSQQVARLAVQWLNRPEWYPEPAGVADVVRCVASLAAWLCPLPAMLIGLALRRSDVQVQQQAALDGALWRVTFRQLAVPIAASAAMVGVLAVQEFAVYEPTGISVVATEVRMVFETGAYSAPDNPITQPGLSGAGQSPSLSPILADQRARAAAAVATSLPLLGVVLLFAGLALLGARKLSAAGEMETGDWPRALDAPRWVILLAWSIVGVTVFLPLLGLILSLHRAPDLRRIWDEFRPQLLGSIALASLSAGGGFALALSACLRRSRWMLLLGVVAFLIGGQLLAIALIRTYNPPPGKAGQRLLAGILQWVYHGPPLIVMAYLARFAWVPLAAALATWSRPWRHLREMAAVDGADRVSVAFRIIWPLAWPGLCGAAVLVMILSLTEVPATVLISPLRPQPLIPMLMTWVHMLRYDAMIEGSLLLVLLVVLLGAVAMLLIAIGRRSRLLPALLPALPLLVLPLAGCDGLDSPDEIWLTTGQGPAQVVYPRGITYSPASDTFFVVDRVARIQQLDRKGQFVNEWRMPQQAQGKPVGLSAGPDGNLYVPDTHYHRVMVYSPDGTLLRQWGGRGTEAGQFIYPTDIAFDSSGNVYVAEYGDNDRIQVFDRHGKFLRQFGHFGDEPGQLSRPQSILIDGELLYVADACNHRIGVWRTDGTFVRNFGKIGSGPGEFRFPYGLDMDTDGHLIVCEFGNNRVQKIDKTSGQSLGVWGGPGREPGQLAYPWGVAVDKRNRVVAVDAGNNRLQVFGF